MHPSRVERLTYRSIMNENSKTIWTVVLQIAKYAITLALGFIGGSASAMV